MDTERERGRNRESEYKLNQSNILLVDDDDNKIAIIMNLPILSKSERASECVSVWRVNERKKREHQ